jgi:flagellar biogenesis protein FliO
METHFDFMTFIVVTVNLILALFLFGFAIYMFKVMIQLAKKAIVALDIYIQNHKK